MIIFIRTGSWSGDLSPHHTCRRARQIESSSEALSEDVPATGGFRRKCHGLKWA